MNLNEMMWTETNLNREHLHENGYNENDLKSVCSQVRVKYAPANPVCGLVPRACLHLHKE